MDNTEVTNQIKSYEEAIAVYKNTISNLEKELIKVRTENATLASQLTNSNIELTVLKQVQDLNLTAKPTNNDIVTDAELDYDEALKDLKKEIDK